jgi:hypothetical protein
MISGLRQTWRPAAYHGEGHRPPFFEGWYYKLVDRDAGHRWAVIPGVFLGQQRDASHCFVQTLDGLTGAATYHRYPLDQFRHTPGEFDFWIGSNHFGSRGLSLEIVSPERTLRGELTFPQTTPWPVTWTSPGIMGPYAFAPFMECYHGVLSFDHAMEGALTVDSHAIDFTGGRGYIEKDWGQAFPKAWIWLQSNHFGAVGTSLTASIAIIPWLRSAFPGFIVGLWHQNRLFRFATYTGAITETLSLSDTQVAWRMIDRRPQPAVGARCRLEIVAQRAGGGLLHSPERVAMMQRVVESLTARVSVRLLAGEGVSERVLLEDTGQCAGLEIVGPVDEMQAMLARQRR